MHRPWATQPLRRPINTDLALKTRGKQKSQAIGGVKMGEVPMPMFCSVGEATIANKGTSP